MDARGGSKVGEILLIELKLRSSIPGIVHRSRRRFWDRNRHGFGLNEGTQVAFISKLFKELVQQLLGFINDQFLHQNGGIDPAQP